MLSLRSQTRIAINILVEDADHSFMLTLFWLTGLFSALVSLAGRVSPLWQWGGDVAQAAWFAWLVLGIVVSSLVFGLRSRP